MDSGSRIVERNLVRVIVSKGGLSLAIKQNQMLTFVAGIKVNLDT